MASVVTSNWKLSVSVTAHILSFVGIKDTTQAAKVYTVFRASSRMNSLWNEFARQYHITLCNKEVHPKEELRDRLLRVNETMRYILGRVRRQETLDKNLVTEFEQHCKLLQASPDFLSLWIEIESKAVNSNPARGPVYLEHNMIEKVRIFCDQLIDANFQVKDTFINSFPFFSANVLIHVLKQLSKEKQLEMLESYFMRWLSRKCEKELIDRQYIFYSHVSNKEDLIRATSAFFSTEKGKKYINDILVFIDYCFSLKPNFDSINMQIIGNALLLLSVSSDKFREVFIKFFELYQNYVSDTTKIEWAIDIAVAPQLIALMLQRVTVTNEIVQKLEAAKNPETRKLAPFAEKALQEFHGSVLDLLKGMGRASAGPGLAAADR